MNDVAMFVAKIDVVVTVVVDHIPAVVVVFADVVTVGWSAVSSQESWSSSFPFRVVTT